MRILNIICCLSVLGSPVFPASPTNTVTNTEAPPQQSSPAPDTSDDTDVQILHIERPEDRMYLVIEEVPLKQLLPLLARRNHLNFLMPADDLPVIRDNISLEVRHMSSRQVLDFLLRHKNLELYSADTEIYTVRPKTNQMNYHVFELNDNFMDRFKGSTTGIGGGGGGSYQGVGGNVVNAAATFTVENGGKYSDIAKMLEEVASTVDASSKSRLWYYPDKQKILMYGSDDAAKAIKQYLAIANETNPNIRIDVRIYASAVNPQTKLGVDWAATMNPGLTVGLNPSSQINTNNFATFNNLESLAKAFGNPLNTLILKNDIQATVNFFVKETQARAVTEPSTITANDREVAFAATQQIPYIGGSYGYNYGNVPGGFGGGYDSTSFVNVGATINILPRIQRGQRIKLGTAISISQLDAMIKVSAGTGSSPPREVPQTSGRAYNGEFTINSGETLVIAGLKTWTESKDFNKIPIAGDIPILGKLFRNRSNSKQTAYLTIFITATILDEKHQPVIASNDIKKEDRVADPDAPWMTVEPNAANLVNLAVLEDPAILNAKRKRENYKQLWQVEQEHRRQLEKQLAWLQQQQMEIETLQLQPPAENVKPAVSEDELARMDSLRQALRDLQAQQKQLEKQLDAARAREKTAHQNYQSAEAAYLKLCKPTNKQ